MSHWVKDESKSPPSQATPSSATTTGAPSLMTPTAYSNPFTYGKHACQNYIQGNSGSMSINTSVNYLNPNSDLGNLSPVSTNTPNTPNSATVPPPLKSAASVPISPASSVIGGVTPSELTSRPKAKRVRTSKPKVKTGCTNCKQRRIKCDEARPACTQCVRSKKTCTGYPPPPRGSRPFEEIRIAPKPLASAQPSTTVGSPFHINDVVLPPRRARQRIVQRQAAALNPSVSTYQPSMSLRLPPTEGPYFEIFRSHTANELSGYFDNEFWTHRVLQECHSEAAIKHAVIALGALYQTLEHNPGPGTSGTPNSNPRFQALMGHWQIAVKRYSDACNALVGLNAEDQRSHRTLIMANVLLACFDSFIGDHRQAINQIQTGITLLERFRSRQQDRLLMDSPGPPESPLEDELLTMFTRLAIQAKSYDMAFHFPQPYVIRLNPPQSISSPASAPSPSTPSSSGVASPPADSPLTIPENFASLIEARAACDKLNERIMRYIEGLYAVKTDSKGTLPRSWREYGLEFKHQIETWCDAFEHLFHSRHSRNPQEKAAIAALKMLQTNSQVLYLMMFSDKEADFDAFLPQFQAIVDLAVEIVGDEEKRAAARRCPNPDQCTHSHLCDQTENGAIFSGPGYSAPHIKPRFAADLGIVAPLFVVGTKCRDPVTRRQAIQLLRSSARREGMWDSTMVANICMWVMELEESQTLAMEAELGMENDNKIPRTIPEEKRVMVRAVDFDLRTRTAHLEVGTRGLQPGLPDPKFNQTRLVW